MKIVKQALNKINPIHKKQITIPYVLKILKIQSLLKIMINRLSYAIVPFIAFHWVVRSKLFWLKSVSKVILKVVKGGKAKRNRLYRLEYRLWRHVLQYNYCKI